MKCTFGRVLTAVESERTYQRLRWGTAQVDAAGRENLAEDAHSVGDFLTLMQAHMALAIAAFAKNPGTVEALDAIRKVTALGVACMEQHGAVARGEHPVVNARDGKLRTWPNDIDD